MDRKKDEWDEMINECSTKMNDKKGGMKWMERRKDERVDGNDGKKDKWDGRMDEWEGVRKEIG